MAFAVSILLSSGVGVGAAVGLMLRRWTLLAGLVSHQGHDLVIAGSRLGDLGFLIAGGQGYSQNCQ
jgi:hypothetical protein